MINGIRFRNVLHSIVIIHVKDTKEKMIVDETHRVSSEKQKLKEQYFI